MPTFLFPNGTFFPNAGVKTVTPTTGTVVTLPKGTTDVYLTPAGTLAALTVKLPPSPLPGTVVSLASSQTSTTLTVQNAAGAAVAGAPTTLAVNTNVYFQYVGTAWVTMSNMPAGPVLASEEARV
jgi:uncharacterized membrane protein